MQLTDTPPQDYRPGVGLFVLNRSGQVFVGKRMVADHDRAPDPYWQLPQGGLDPSEDPLQGGVRELREETGMTSVMVLALSPAWISYDFPPEIAERVEDGRWRGQTQLWIACLFTGEDAEIDLQVPGEPQEFYTWAWADPAGIPEHVVPFKRTTYAQLLRWFAPYLSPNTVA
jgi:putative (di)nucleoside polyphosphate hydrolase